MPNFSGVWNLKDQVQAIAAGRWTGIPTFELYAWGRNIYGQVGDNTAVYRSSPSQVGALTNWSQVSANSSISSAVKTDGTLWTWGRNSSGQIGDNTIINRSSPVQVGALTNWSQIASGVDHTVSVKTDGTLWTWGDNSITGALGDGTVINRSSPVQVGSLTNWAQVSASTTRSSAVKTDGTLWAWGTNSLGQLGDGTTIARSSPVQVGSLTDWLQVAMGTDHTTAVKTDGTLWAWGQNNAGQMGVPNTANEKSSPVQVGALTNWSLVSAGHTTTVAVKTDGTLWSWGQGSNGALGDNTIVGKSSPVQVGALTTWSSASIGYRTGAALKTDGTLWVWGQNSNGQLGDGTVVDKSSPVQVGVLSSWSAIPLHGSNWRHIVSIFQGTTN